MLWLTGCGTTLEENRPVQRPVPTPSSSGSVENLMRQVYSANPSAVPIPTPEIVFPRHKVIQAKPSKAGTENSNEQAPIVEPTPQPGQPASQQAPLATLMVAPSTLHYGDRFKVAVTAPGASRVDLTLDIDDPPVITLPYDGNTQTYGFEYNVPLKKDTVIDEGEYIVTAIVYNEDGSKYKVDQKIWFYEAK